MSKLDVLRKKIRTRETLTHDLATWKFMKKKIVFTNGCFDLLHLGHVDYLAKAADCGDILVIGLNTDASVKRQKKNPSRPLQDENARAEILAALHVVDIVILFDEETPYDLISFIQPDVLVKGADYKVEQIAGHDIVLGRGGEVKLIDLVPGYSTTAIEKKIREGQ